MILVFGAFSADDLLLSACLLKGKFEGKSLFVNPQPLKTKSLLFCWGGGEERITKKEEKNPLKNTCGSLFEEEGGC